MIEFVIEWREGGESLISVERTDDLDAACWEQFGGEAAWITAAYRNATDWEANCPAILGDVQHSDEWWAGYECEYCGRP